jgi:predicted transcriptional regulator
LIAEASLDEKQVAYFVRAHIGSLYALELLLLLKRDRDKVWQSSELVRELRSSRTAVAGALSRLLRAGLVAENPSGGYSYAPASADQEHLADTIEKAYASRPMAVVRAIVAEPDEKLREFSNAFKLKE